MGSRRKNRPDRDKLKTTETPPEIRVFGSKENLLNARIHSRFIRVQSGCFCSCAKTRRCFGVIHLRRDRIFVTFRPFPPLVWSLSTISPKRYCPVLVMQEGSALWGNTLATALLHHGGISSMVARPESDNTGTLWTDSTIWKLLFNLKMNF